MGSGIAMMTYLGKKTAQNIMDGSNSKSAYLNIDFKDSRAVLSGKPLVPNDNWQLLPVFGSSRT